MTNLDVQMDPLCEVRTSAVLAAPLVVGPYFTGRPSWEKPAKDWWS